MPKIKVPSTPKEPPAPSVKKRHVRLKNAFPPHAAKKKLLVKAKAIAKKRLPGSRKAAQTFREAFGASDDEVSTR